MKTLIITITLCLVGLTNAMAQNKTQTDAKSINITFKNNSLLPRHYNFVTYAPDQDGNGKVGQMLGPNSTVAFTVLAGTKFYLADAKQIDIVMNGKKLTDKPFYTAMTEDDGKTIDLRK